MELIIKLLKDTKRDGMVDLLNDMIKGAFFHAPASTKFHGVYEGGLAQHSLDVYHKYLQLVTYIKIEVSRNSIIIACLLHDLCKMGLYYIDTNGYKTVKPFPPGHGLRSVEMASKFIQLSDLERNMIVYHMGVYGTKEFSPTSGEYSIHELTNNFNNPAIKLMYIADELATVEEKYGLK